MPTKVPEMLKNFFFRTFLCLILIEIGLCVKRGCYGTDEICATCRCSNTTVNCENSMLTEIPYPLPMNLSVLQLNKNKLSSIADNSLNNCLQLVELHLASNNISDLPQSIFRDAPIKYLYLQNNSLNIRSNTKVFLSLSHTLNMLFIHSNKKISHFVFKNLFNLKTLSIDGDLVGGFGKSFSTLKNLHTLTIVKNLVKLTNSTFIHFQNITLRKLILNKAGVKEIERGAFRPLKTLVSLGLSYSSGLRFVNVSGSLNSLSDGLENLTLTNIYGNCNPDMVLGDRFFKKLGKKKNLKVLKLNKNGLIKITSNMFFYIRSLNQLDVSYNHLQYDDKWLLYVTFLVNMKFANFEEQVRKDLERTPAENAQPVNYTENSCRARDLKDVTPCKFRNSGEPNLLCLICPRNLETLRLSRSRNKGVFPVTLIFGNCKISKYFYRSNGVKRATGPIILLQPTSVDPISLDLGDNGMKYLSPDFLKLSIERGLRVGKLILDGNNLSRQLEQDKLGRTFAVYSNLTELNIAKNSIRFVQKLTFYNLTKLEILNLSSNSLHSLDFDISRLKELKVLDLTCNFFATFESDAMSAISSLSQEKGYGWLTLHIEQNAFVCSCDSMIFINWIIDNKTKIYHVDKVTCKYRDTFLRLTDLKDSVNDINLSCYYLLPAAISGGSLALLIISIAVGMIIHKYRWNIRYYLAKHTLKRRRYQLFLNQSKDFAYDAFVSYEMNDRSWIVQELIANLEKESSAFRARPTVAEQNTFGSEELLNSTKVAEERLPKEGKTNDDMFTLCIHERDFELGNRIEENIVNAIQMSRMVILVVSNHFIKSKWCRLEMEMAKMESLERGRNIVVTVFLESIRETLESMEWFMKRYTYLEWFKCDSVSKILEKIERCTWKEN